MYLLRAVGDVYLEHTTCAVLMAVFQPFTHINSFVDLGYI